MKRGWIAVEGHGDIDAALNLVNRLWQGLGRFEPWSAARSPGVQSLQGMSKLAARLRSDRSIGALLILRDEDDLCPRVRAPELAEALRRLDLPFPSSVVLLHPEFEVLFLPCIDFLAGKLLRTGTVSRPGLVPEAHWDRPTWEARRGVKEWLTSQFPKGRTYKPTTDQLPLTQMLDLEVVRRAEVPCFGTLERSLAFLAEYWDQAGAIYPPASA